APHWFLKKPVVIIFGHDFDVSVLLEIGCSSNEIGTTTLDNDGPQVPKMFGLVVVALSIGGHTAKQQLVHSPSVWVSKKKRESIRVVEMPDQVAGEAGRFVDKSFLRKVAHIQDLDAARSGTSDPIRPVPFNTPRATESLKSVGVNPRGH
ncbi:unnamed protein product, partial [Musa textilis]